MQERTRLILFVFLSALLLFGWMPLMDRLGLLPHDQNVNNTLDGGSATQPSTAPAAGNTATTTATGTTQPAVAPTTVETATKPAGDVGERTPAGPVLLPGASASTDSTATFTLQPSAVVGAPTTAPAGIVSIGSTRRQDPNYALRMLVDPVGGGLHDVELTDFRQHVDKEDPYSFQQRYSPTEPDPLSIRTLKIGNTGIDLTGARFAVVERTERSVTLSVDVLENRQPMLTVLEHFEVLPRTPVDEQGPRGYETRVRYEIINRTDRTINVTPLIVGPTFPHSEQSRGGDRMVIAGYRNESVVVLDHDTTESYNKDRLSKNYIANKHGQPLLWFGAGGNYFNAIFRPEDASLLAAAYATTINPESAPLERQVLLTLETKPLELTAGASTSFAGHAFFGPRQRSLLHNAYYKSPGIEYNHSLETTASCAYCTFQWLVDILMGLLNFFHLIFRDYGIAIILLVFIVRALLHPITKRSQINMAKMSKMGPEMERLKKKYGDDKEGLNRAMMQFYKSHGAAPILGCLPMFLQMPIWIALYSGLSSTFELRHEPLFWGLTWINDLARPDHLVEFSPANQINFLMLHIDGINIIPVLLAGAFFMQFKLQPKPATMTPEQQQQQTLMKYMTTFLFPIMLYSSPSGLNLYILASTCFGMIESYIVRKHIREQEELAAAGPTVVDAEVIDAPAPSAGGRGKGLIGWFTELQQRAEQMRAEAETKTRKKR